MFMTKDYSEQYGVPGPMFTTLEYGLMCEVLGSSSLAPEATNCAAPDTGNMHLLARFANEEQKKKYLMPLMNGEVRSTFSATEPDVASADMTNIHTRIERDPKTGDYIVNGRKTWQSSFFHPKWVSREPSPSEARARARRAVIALMDANLLSISSSLLTSIVVSQSCYRNFALPFPHLPFARPRSARFRCAFLICVGLSNPNGDRHSKQSVIIIEKNTPGIIPITNRGLIGGV